MFKQKIKQEETKLKKKNDTVSDIIYIIDKMREDNNYEIFLLITLYFFINN